MWGCSERPVDAESLHRRVVHGGRGGMCQEMNPLLFANLQRLGFDCYQGMASVVLAGSLQPAEQPFEGLVTSKNLGDTITCMGTHQAGATTDNLHCFAGGQWVDVYYFTRALATQPVIAACAEASFRSHPLFSNHVVVTKPLPDGRVTLMDWELKVRKDGTVVEQRVLTSEEERDAVLEDVFGLNLA
ncbi:hypothetical protein COO60DRAFT_1462259 [Scenedesmus sp. NREL 46B-D3]|nr:hypothetical protein COO60DRAFT_1462259 [Scenedesmus sp. NREL 46B-D3]